MGRDGNGGSRKKEMPGGLRRLRHVIRPSPARAFPACASPLSLYFPSPPRGGAAEGSVWPTPPHPPSAGSCGCLARAACSEPGSRRQRLAARLALRG